MIWLIYMKNFMAQGNNYVYGQCTFFFVELVTYSSNLLIQIRLLLCKVSEIN